MIRIILWDVDGTLLDFKAAEGNAIRACFAKFDLGECTDGMLARYSEINRRCWEKLERGEMTKPEVLVRRFEQFFTEYGLNAAVAADFNEAYQLELGETVVFCDRGDELVRSLRHHVKQYAVTNGTLVAQRRKLDKSGLIRLLDDVFISDCIGVEKPNMGFFDAVFAKLGPVNKDEVLIVGDSLTSDMQGGNNAGIRCCWYNPKNLPAPEGLRLDYIIRDLNQVRDILGLARER